MAAKKENTTASVTPKKVIEGIHFSKNEKSDEANKFSFEVAKHITTLDSGIILVFTSLNSNWITSPGIASNIDLIQVILGIVTVTTFLVSTIACVLVMFLIPYQLGEEKTGIWQNWGTDGLLVLGLASFIAGILLIIIITFINLIF